MSNEQRAHDLTILYIEMLNKLKQSNNSNQLEINLLEDYLHFYPIVLEQLSEGLSHIQ